MRVLKDREDADSLDILLRDFDAADTDRGHSWTVDLGRFVENHLVKEIDYFSIQKVDTITLAGQIDADSHLLIVPGGLGKIMVVARGTQVYSFTHPDICRAVMPPKGSALAYMSKEDSIIYRIRLDDRRRENPLFDQAKGIIKEVVRSGAGMIRKKAKVPYADQALDYLEDFVSERRKALPLPKICVAEAIPSDLLAKSGDRHHVKESVFGEADFAPICDVRFARMAPSYDQYVKRIAIEGMRDDDIRSIEFHESLAGRISGFRVSKDEDRFIFHSDGLMRIVLVDMRRNSATFGLANSVISSARNAHVVRIPKGVSFAYESIEKARFCVFRSVADQESHPELYPSEAIPYRHWM